MSKPSRTAPISMKDTSISAYAFAGNAAHLLSLASTITFAMVVATQFNTSFFDASWRRDGFCVTNLDVPYWNSHDACLYFDTAAAIVLSLIYYLLKGTPGMDAANEQLKVAIPGILAHGMGHGSVAAQLRAGTISHANSLNTTLEILLATRGGDGNMTGFVTSQLLPGIIFWLALLKASMPNVKNSTVVMTSVAAMVAQFYFTPQVFGFTFVQTVLMVAFSLNQLARPAMEKDFAYALYPAMVGFPVTCIGWMESTMCTRFVRDAFYGHLAYDGFIPLAFLGWYLACYVRATAACTSVPVKIKMV